MYAKKASSGGRCQCDTSTKCSATELKQGSESRRHSKTGVACETSIIKNSKRPEDADVGNCGKKNGTKILKSTAEHRYDDICRELRGQLGLKVNDDSGHNIGHCCFCGDIDDASSSQDSTVGEDGYTANDSRNVKSLQRTIRTSLYEAGVLESVGPWLACNDITIKVRQLSSC